MKSLERRLARLTTADDLRRPASRWELALLFGEERAEALLASGYSLPPGFWRDLLQEIDGKTRGLPPPRRAGHDAPP